MNDTLNRMFGSDGFMPHGMCYLWRSDVLALHVISDALIVLAYFSIPFSLVYFVRKRKNLDFDWMFLCFAVFIVACGTTHALEIWTIWQPLYWLSGGVKAITALASVPTAVLLVKLIPDALSLPTPAELKLINEELRREITERERAEHEVRRMNEELESRVAERTRQLADMNDSLQQAYDDLSQSQRALLQQERLRALGEMASGIAHDINNAISPIALYAESLRERESLSIPGRKQLATMQRAIEDVANTVSRLREFYRPREAALAQEPIDLNEIVKQAVDLTRARWCDVPQRDGILIHVRTDLAAHLLEISGERHEIRDALTNLIFNAVDAMPNGGSLVLRTEAGDATTRRVSVEVGDSGIGMDDETRKRCLEPFFTTKGERGTGLGLAMVYGMTQRHGAELEIESSPGAGTKVRLSFPALAARPSARVSAHTQTPAARTSRILIVDDDLTVLQSLRDVLQADGHVVTTVEGGQSGIDAFAAAHSTGQPFDVVITDLGMPRVDGRRVAAAIRALSPATPIVLLTGWGQRLVADGNIPSDVDHVLAKPPKLHELRATLAKITAAKGSSIQSKTGR
jgi:signal transduction histidine kinase/ActR/RegA family two-component response regulator